MDKKGILEQLIIHFAKGNQSLFARLLGLSQSTVGTWSVRKTFNAEQIKAVFPQVDGNWLLTGEGEMLLPDDQGTIQVGGHHNTTQINSTGNIETTKSSDNEVITLQHTIELLQKDNAALHALLDEKERLIKVLLDKG
ncbi:helix-turn-helix domain-containing protein [Prevotellamassilia timonensis]|uniref:helix-turn-helix domain-containing protein n=1 Tax=Prevotellamassilia timonensis TaxID=1852370 RepID=UPI003079F848